MCKHLETGKTDNFRNYQLNSAIAEAEHYFAIHKEPIVKTQPEPSSSTVPEKIIKDVQAKVQNFNDNDLSLDRIITYLSHRGSTHSTGRKQQVKT